MLIHANPPAVCDICQTTIGNEFYDAKTRFGPWGDLCPQCFKAHSFGKLGTGYGQHYKFVEGKGYVKVEG